MYELMENGLPIGPFPEAVYSNVNMHIEPGDRIVMYTDGIIEATDASGSFFGYDSFKNFIKAHEDVSVERFTDMFLEHLFKWSGKPQGTSLDDDLTLIVIDID